MAGRGFGVFNKKWDNEEIEDLYDNYQYYLCNKDEACKVFGLRWHTISLKASFLGLTNSNSWTEEEINDLSKNYIYYRKHNNLACDRFRRKWYAIEVKAIRLGLSLKHNKRYKSKYNILKSPLVDLLNGLLLSDGCVSIYKSTGYYIHTSTEYNYLEYIKKYFDVCGIESTINVVNRKNYSFKNSSVEYLLRTLSYIEFKELHSKWYKKDYNVDEYPTRVWHWDKEKEEWFAWHKIVPKDIRLNPLCVANWYYGDGSIWKRKHNQKCYSMNFSTQCFYYEDIELLIDELYNSIDIKGIISKNKIININYQCDILKFFNYISEYTGDFYINKFPNTDIIINDDYIH